MAKQAKSKIVTAAFQLFLENGYKGVSLADIIKATQLSKGAIYHHFDSKYEIYIAAMEEYFFKILHMEFPKDDDLPIQLRIRKRFEAFVDIIDFVEHIDSTGINFPIRSYFIFQLESEKDENILPRIKKAMDNYSKEINKMVKYSIKNKEIITTLPAKIMANQIMSMIEGIMIHHSSVKHNCKKLLMKQFDELIASYLQLLKHPQLRNTQK